MISKISVNQHNLNKKVNTDLSFNNMLQFNNAITVDFSTNFVSGNRPRLQFIFMKIINYSTINLGTAFIVINS